MAVYMVWDHAVRVRIPAPRMELEKSKKLHWTSHSRYKMAFYKLSEGRIKRILRLPKRVERGIASDTVAMMQPSGTVKNPYEVWVMVQDVSSQRKIISAWRYPGKTKPRSEALLGILNNEYSEYNS